MAKPDIKTDDKPAPKHDLDNGEHQANDATAIDWNAYHDIKLRLPKKIGEKNDPNL